jgi:hypothetical protein
MSIKLIAVFILNLCLIEIASANILKSDEVVTVESELINTESPLITTELPQIINDDIETDHILTENLFEIRLTIKGDWDDSLIDRNSPKFRELARTIDTELSSLIENEKNANLMPPNSFRLMNLVPSISTGYLYAIIVGENNANVTLQEIEDAIDIKLRMYSRLYEVEAEINGFEVKAITNEDLQKFDDILQCDSGKKKINFNLINLKVN